MRRPPFPIDWLLAAEAVVALFVAALAVALLPFARSVRLGAVRLGAVRLGAIRPGSGSLGRAGGTSTEAIIWAVTAASARVPWRSVCFHDGLAAQYLLRRRGIDARLHYGAAIGEALSAHVWVTVDGEPVIGGAEAGPFAELYAVP